MDLARLRQEVRRVLRDDSFPTDDIDAAINRTILNINNAGRFRFHEATHTITLTATTYMYAVETDILAEHAFVYRAFTTSQKVLDKIQGGPENALGDNTDFFTSTGEPKRYMRYGGYWYIDPVPDAVANGRTITIFSFKDLAALVSPTDTNALPDRHRNVLVYGAAIEINPLLRPEGKAGPSYRDMFNAAFAGMVLQEKWNPDIMPTMVRGPRWNSASTWGNVSTIQKR